MAKFRTEKAGIEHCAIAAVDFDLEKIKDNLIAVVRDVRKAKPSTSKGTYIKKVTRSEEHTSELQSLMRISYAVFCLKKKKTQTNKKIDTHMLLISYNNIRQLSDDNLDNNNTLVT